MRMKIKGLFCALICTGIAIATPSVSRAQQYEAVPVTISKEKLKVDGVVCYSHIVRERQTLYSICKAYQVTPEDIYKYNPAVKENGLKKNTILIIPSVSKKEEASDPKEQKPVGVGPVKEEQLKEEEVKEEEVARQEERPAVIEKPSAGQESGKAEKKGRKRKVHTVKWYEDIEDIAQKYGVSAEAIMEVNSLKDRKLTTRQKIQIPFQEEDSLLAEQYKTNGEGIVQIEEPQPGEAGIYEEDANSREEDRRYLFDFRKSETDLALLLPLKADGQAASRNNMDFYSGVLIAVRDLGNEGINVNLKVIDTAIEGKSSDIIDTTSCDIVIGPVSYNDMNVFIGGIPSWIPVISPLDPKVEALAGQYSNLIQAPTSHQTQYFELAKWMKEELAEEDRIIIITEKGYKESSVNKMLTAAVDSLGMAWNSFSYSILEGRDILEPLTALMTDSATNRFIVASESEAFVNDVVRNLNLLIHNKFEVVLYAPAKIRSFETIEVENLHNTHLHVCHSYSIDYDDAKVRNFLLEYRALFNAEPSQYAFQGYDIARWCIEMHSKYGRRWTENLDRHDKDMLQSYFKFRKMEGGGWENEGVRRILYENGWKVSQQSVR